MERHVGRAAGQAYEVEEIYVESLVAERLLAVGDAEERGYVVGKGVEIARRGHEGDELSGHIAHSELLGVAVNVRTERGQTVLGGSRVEGPHEAVARHALPASLAYLLHFHAAPAKWRVARNAVYFLAEHRHGQPLVEQQRVGRHLRAPVVGTLHAERLQGVHGVHTVVAVSVCGEERRLGSGGHHDHARRVDNLAPSGVARQGVGGGRELAQGYVLAVLVVVVKQVEQLCAAQKVYRLVESVFQGLAAGQKQWLVGVEFYLTCDELNSCVCD